MATAATQPVLSVRDLKVATRGRQPNDILKGISFDIHPGETLCLVGESGSGKSVTSLVAMDLLPRDELRATAGAVRFNGEDILTATPARTKALRGAEMAMIFQEPMTALNPVLTIGLQMDEVYWAHTKMRPKERRDAALAAFEAVHLPDPQRIYDSYPHQLSGGQRQRVMIAMALALKPKLLIADEPTTALDVTTQKQILSLIRELQDKQNTAVLFITHDMGVVVDIADRVCVMRRGEIVETGPVEQVLSRPREAYTRDLLQSVPSLTPRAPRASSGGEAVLEIRNLEKTFSFGSLFGKLMGRESRSVRAVKDVSFGLARGRTLGIVGESGSGKSTVARCLMRLEHPTGGEIRVNGQDIANLQGQQALAPARRRVQMVFQDPNRSLNPRLCIGESLIEGPLNLGEDRETALTRAGELMEVVGLPSSSLDRFPHQFSGGQRQRIAIARALMMEPEVIVADEAVSALDVSVQAQVLALLAEIQERRNLAVLFITHDLRVAAQICDEVMVMQRGSVVEMGPAAEVLGRPSHEYTRALINAAPGRDWDFAAGRRIAGATV
ncbi:MULTISPECIES: ABC transporter ATP-binding protein [Bosea]|uniref:ABC transporter ATP-binding protein n=1 Tax=Bosea TaxID=85413 RepID=UPI0021500386|nr:MULTISPECIES: ABC transporter ATP-binding protein [Bosea]MCR4521575.1 ABC transporter ATP-binding protein [Bosea sp. 47.2.35]MDR6829320.1 peptide/nickel transport system ATP-binding protein [Bosea robiniae]MDR6896165.1 peptide/nickel transport system ATP-binding protein [Bosea sp. BE109]MDR7139601.1 peptide/nickel transport system ATP-binding protein [Bosea sp. BE168]MDR7176260.1 peptide/nickel transport system ATP-binding protein [Bosea sp. BE271]